MNGKRRAAKKASRAWMSLGVQDKKKVGVLDTALCLLSSYECGVLFFWRGRGAWEEEGS